MHRIAIVVATEAVEATVVAARQPKQRPQWSSSLGTEYLYCEGVAGMHPLAPLKVKHFS